VALATLATVIASQAVITGSFSLTQQAIQLGLLPRLRVIHTSSHERGQIYVPFVNWALAALTLGAVLGFGSSSRLAGAYGLAVSFDMVITTVLATYVALHWGHRPVLVYLLNGSLLLVDLVFFAANTTKLFEGGWFPLLISVVVAFLMLTWRKGQQLVQRARKHLRMSTRDFLRQLESNPPIRIPGVAVVMSASTSSIPGTLLHHLKHNRVLHERVLLVSVLVLDTPVVADDDRVHAVPVGAGIQRVVLRLGFTEKPNVPDALRLAISQRHVPAFDPEEVTYYVGRQTVIATKAHVGMALWREMIFAMLNRNAELTADYFCIPAPQVVEIGSSVEI
jgi:KUP system potassium uptake protein